MDTIFLLIAVWLQNIARRTGTTYNAVNIWLYYIAIPLSWAVLLDIALKSFIAVPVTLALMLAAYLICRKRNITIDDIFRWSVLFTLLFGKTRKQYNSNCVLLYVFLPLFIYVVLILLIIL
jgi:hypothetical protein